MPQWFYAPWDWVAYHSNARLRRAIGGWAGVLFIVATAASWTRKEDLWVIWALQILGLILLAWSIVTTETPVEEES